jgi:hypothetical protein
MDKDDIEKLLDECVPVEEIAEKYSGEFCVQDFEMENEYCHEDADCNDCWINCLNKCLSQ